MCHIPWCQRGKLYAEDAASPATACAEGLGQQAYWMDQELYRRRELYSSWTRILPTADALENEKIYMMSIESITICDQKSSDSRRLTRFRLSSQPLTLTFITHRLEVVQHPLSFCFFSSNVSPFFSRASVTVFIVTACPG